MNFYRYTHLKIDISFVQCCNPCLPCLDSKVVPEEYDWISFSHLQCISNLWYSITRLYCTVLYSLQLEIAKIPSTVVATKQKHCKKPDNQKKRIVRVRQVLRGKYIYICSCQSESLWPENWSTNPLLLTQELSQIFSTFCCC